MNCYKICPIHGVEKISDSPGPKPWALWQSKLIQYIQEGTETQLQHPIGSWKPSTNTRQWQWQVNMQTCLLVTADKNSYWLNKANVQNIQQEPTKKHQPDTHYTDEVQNPKPDAQTNLSSPSNTNIDSKQ